METPYNGQAILNDTLNGLEIIIPAKRNWVLIIFLGAWLGGWTIGESFAIGTLIGFSDYDLGFANLFMLFWLCGWTVAGFFVVKTLVWYLAGKEIITFGQGQFSIAKQGLLLSKPKIYDLKHVKKLRARKEETIYYGFEGVRNNLGAMSPSNGTLQFDYGMKTVKFANDIDEAEANFIIDKLKVKSLITEGNL